MLQDEPSAASTGGTIYLTNIHRLYDPAKRRKSKEAEEYDWMGPKVSKAKALDPSEELRERIAAHRRLMVINDEAHHVWDPGSAWNEAIRFLQANRGARRGLVAQLDFSATPKDLDFRDLTRRRALTVTGRVWFVVGWSQRVLVRDIRGG